MTSRLISLEDAFPRRTAPLLMTAVVAGDPFVEATCDYMHAVVAGGADIIEVVVPFSDPVYHGPVMRRASRRAMSEKVSWEDVETLVADFREDDDETPVVVSSYTNRILARGQSRSAQGLADAGVDGVMVTDLPAEEASPFRHEVENRQMVLLQTVAPTTTDKRFRQLAADARGLLVWTGHVGAELGIDVSQFEQRLRTLRQLTSLPIVASMSIESGEEAARVARSAHGVLVGSALSWLVEGKGPDVEARLEAFVADLRLHLDGIEG